MASTLTKVYSHPPFTLVLAIILRMAWGRFSFLISEAWSCAEARKVAWQKAFSPLESMFYWEVCRAAGLTWTPRIIDALLLCSGQAEISPSYTMYIYTCILHSHGMLIKDKEELKIDHLRIVSECSGFHKAFGLNSMLSISALILQMNRAAVGVWWGRMAALCLDSCLLCLLESLCERCVWKSRTLSL